LEQLFQDTVHAARQRFSGKPVRVWIAKLAPKTWKSIVFHAHTKVRLVDGPVRRSPQAALTAIKNQMDSAMRQTS